MKPTQVLEQQALLRDRLTTREYQAYMQPFLEDIARKESGPTVNDPVTGKPSGFHFCGREQKRLEMAEAYFVSTDMMALASWASQSLDESDSFRHDLWPTDHGFMWLDEPLIGKEMWGRTVLTKALSWGRSMAHGVPGTLVVFYTDMNDERDEVNAWIKQNALDAGQWAKYERMGSLHVHHIMWLPDGSRVGPATITPSADYAQYAGEFEALDGDLVKQTLGDNLPNDRRVLLSILMLMNQTVTSVTTEDANKQTAKRMRRMNMPQRVTVVALRRSEGSRKEGEALVEWQHRWLVRGFWRWQAYGKRDDSHTHQMGEVFSEAGRMVRLCETAGCDRHWERIYVAPFVKGPESAPFKQSTKVYALQR